MTNQSTGHYAIDPELFTRPIESIKKLGADRIADIERLDLLIGLRNDYLIVAKDLICNTDRAFKDYEFGVLHCEMAEKIQEVIDLWETEIGTEY